MLPLVVAASLPCARGTRQDRPNTLEWIIKYNIWPGELMIVFFAHLFTPSGQRALVYIIVFVTGVGDGLAEPVRSCSLTTVVAAP